VRSRVCVTRNPVHRSVPVSRGEVSIPIDAGQCAGSAQLTANGGGAEAGLVTDAFSGAGIEGAPQAIRQAHKREKPRNISGV